MGRPYSSELAKLPETLEWAMGSDLGPLCRAIRTASLSPLLAIGSGGSLTAAHALASLHQTNTGYLSAVATPLESIANPIAPTTSAWLLSAGGRNVDILAAFRALVAREPHQLAILCGNAKSPLATASRKHGYVDLVVYTPPTGKDGFLATNSLLGFVTLLSRAYSKEFGESGVSDEQMNHVRQLLGDGEQWESWREVLKPVWGRPTTLVLYGSATRVGAVDLESKFTEAALGNLQIADFRNFAHGRHHWLAKRADESAVIAFVDDRDKNLAERTLNLIPRRIPQVRLPIPGPATTSMLIALGAALRITGWAGEARGIDPGRPGVPEFGRRLYHLPLPKSRRRNVARNATDDDCVAIERKSGLSIDRISRRGELQRWQEALEGFLQSLQQTEFAGVVLDYDGTVVDTRERFSPPSEAVTAELIRIVEAGFHVGIATGRGSSVRRDLASCIPKHLHTRVVVGYYNGAELGSLDDTRVPDGSATVCAELSAVASALREQSELADLAEQTDRRYQITLQARRPTTESRLWDLAQQAALLAGHGQVKITRSSHSIDIVPAGVTKLSVLNLLRSKAQGRAVLAIGDRGRWPGNDYELLREPLSLSVDELNVDPQTCWNLAPRGQRGVAATLGYLRALRPVNDALKYERNG